MTHLFFPNDFEPDLSDGQPRTAAHHPQTTACLACVLIEPKGSCMVHARNEKPSKLPFAGSAGQSSHFKLLAPERPTLSASAKGRRCGASRSSRLKTAWCAHGIWHGV